MSFNFIIDKISLNDFVESLDVKFTLTITFSIDKFTHIHVSVTVFESALTPEVVFFELSSVFLIVESVDAVTVFFTIDKISLIDTSVGFMKDTSSVFFSVSEITFILNIFVQITEMSLTIELVILEFTLVLHNTLQSIFAITVFFALSVEIAFVVSSVTFIDGSMTHSIFAEFASKSLSIVKDKL